MTRLLIPLGFVGGMGCFVNDVLEDTSTVDTPTGATSGAQATGGAGGSLSSNGGAGAAGSGGGETATGGSSTGTGETGAGGQAACSLDAGEACEDCNVLAGDGCSAHQIEPGWYCPTPLEFCWKASGGDLAPGTALAAFGGTGGEPFNVACSPGRVLVGLDATLLTTNNQLYSLQARCAPLTIGAGGQLTWAAATNTPPIQGGNGGSEAASPPRDCPPGKLWTGYRLYRNPGQYNAISGAELVCATVHADQLGVIFSQIETLPVYGITTAHLIDLECEPGSVLTGMRGRSGLLVDSFSGICSPLTPAYCGDGIVGGAEVCDDGNAASGDQCDSCMLSP